MFPVATVADRQFQSPARETFQNIPFNFSCRNVQQVFLIELIFQSEECGLLSCRYRFPVQMLFDATLYSNLLGKTDYFPGTGDSFPYNPVDGGGVGSVKLDYRLSFR